MSAIAGVAGGSSTARRNNRTQDILDAQRVYGSAQSHLNCIGEAAFGISPSAGASANPVVADGHLLLVADIRLDNRDELAERVGARSARSDSELLLAAWQKAGEDCLSWIAGDFALGVFDSRTRILTLARDPTGQVPLHYAQMGDTFAFATMPGGLRPFLGGMTIDRLALARTVSILRDDDPHSAFEQIARVLPAELVRLQAGGLQRKIYWTPRTAADSPLPAAGLIDEYRHLLDIAVKSRLKGCATPLASHLSSGYDSSSVTATAARLLSSPDELIAFTSAPAVAAPMPPELWRIADESQIAASTAVSLGVRHIIVRESSPYRSVIRRQSLLFQEPIVSVPNVAWLLQIRREAAAAGATCLLTGDGGNFSLNAGGLYVLSEWVRRGRWLTWARQARLAAARADTHWRGVLYNSFRPWIPAPVSNRLLTHFLGAGASDRESFLRPEWRAKAIQSACPPPPYRDGYDERAHWLRTGNQGMLRKASLAGEGIDERDPLSDRRLIEFSLRLPPEQLYWNGVQRPLARAALADRIPQSVIDLKVRGLQGADWAMRFTQAEASAMLEEISASATARELFDLNRMRQAIDRWPTDNWNQRQVHHTYRMCLLLALSAGMFALVHEQGGSVAAEVL